MSRVDSQVMAGIEIEYWHVKLLLEWRSASDASSRGVVVKLFFFFLLCKYASSSNIQTARYGNSGVITLTLRLE